MDARDPLILSFRKDEDEVNGEGISVCVFYEHKEWEAMDYHVFGRQGVEA
jgi:hypothetical protein